MTQHRILMIDDDEEDYHILKKSLEKIGGNYYTLEWIHQWHHTMGVDYLRPYDIILVDYRLGPQNGIVIIQEAIEAGLSNAFILLTGLDDPKADTAAQAAGAMDYIVKGSFTPHELDRTLRYSLSRARDLAAIKALNTELEERVQERTESLQQTVIALERQIQATVYAQKKVDDILQVLKKSLEKERELSELKSNFVSMASHEFRTPLTSISSSADLISIYTDRNDLEKIKKHAYRIKHSVENLTSILGDFLSLGRLEEGKMVANRKDMNLPELVEDVRDELKYYFKPGQTFEYHHTGPVSVFLDPNLLKNVLLNLISNAIKYSPEQTNILVESTISSEKINIKITDYGIGISEEDQGKLFGRFFRAGNATNIQGTGLGLYIVKNYIEMMNGCISCESTLGKGSTFGIAFQNIAP